MKNNGHKRNLPAEIAFHQKALTIPPAARPRLLAWLRRAKRRPPRTFWLLDPLTGDWRLL